MSRNLVVPPSYGRRPVVGLAGGLSMANIAAMQGWWNASSFTGTAPGNGGPVATATTLTDLTGKGNALACSNTLACAQWDQAAGPNGTPSFAMGTGFGAVDAYFTAPSNAGTVGTFFIVVLATASQSIACIGDNGLAAQDFTSNATPNFVHAGINTTVAAGGTHKIIFLRSVAAGTFDCWNGLSQVLTAQVGDCTGVGGAINIGTNNAHVIPVNFRWSEAGFWNVKITDPERIQATNFLKAKYNL